MKRFPDIELWDEAVRQHYLSLEGKGAKYREEAAFFLLWLWDLRGARA
ncbi:MAG: hypothetical protein ACRDZ4_17695 [Egibacteraceae bacterium]